MRIEMRTMGRRERTDVTFEARKLDESEVGMAWDE